MLSPHRTTVTQSRNTARCYSLYAFAAPSCCLTARRHNTTSLQQSRPQLHYNSLVHNFTTTVSSTTSLQQSRPQLHYNSLVHNFTTTVSSTTSLQQSRPQLHYNSLVHNFTTTVSSTTSLQQSRPQLHYNSLVHNFTTTVSSTTSLQQSRPQLHYNSLVHNFTTTVSSTTSLQQSRPQLHYNSLVHNFTTRVSSILHYAEYWPAPALKSFLAFTVFAQTQALAHSCIRFLFFFSFSPFTFSDTSYKTAETVFYPPVFLRITFLCFWCTTSLVSPAASSFLCSPLCSTVVQTLFLVCLILP